MCTIYCSQLYASVSASVSSALLSSLCFVLHWVVFFVFRLHSELSEGTIYEKLHVNIAGMSLFGWNHSQELSSLRFFVLDKGGKHRPGA